MNYRQLQFSIKFSKFENIRRHLNEIEDVFKDLFGVPQTVPVPDDFNPQVPRVVMSSKDGLCQISFSQISIDFSVRSSEEVLVENDACLEYTSKIVNLVKDFFIKVGISDFCYMGVICNLKLNIKGMTALDFAKKRLDKECYSDGLYDVSQRLVSVKDNEFFVNEQIDTYHEPKEGITNIPEFRQGKDFSNEKSVALSIDVNNRYSYIQSGNLIAIDEIKPVLQKIYAVIEEVATKWRMNEHE